METAARGKGDQVEKGSTAIREAAAQTKGRRRGLTPGKESPNRETEGPDGGRGEGQRGK